MREGGGDGGEREGGEREGERMREGGGDGGEREGGEREGERMREGGGDGGEREGGEREVGRDSTEAHWHEKRTKHVQVQQQMICDSPHQIRYLLVCPSREHTLNDSRYQELQISSAVQGEQ